jgi:hypothetical protein
MATPFNFDPLLIAALADIDKARALLDEARAARGPGNKGLYAVVEAEVRLEEAERARDWLADVRTLVATIMTGDVPVPEARTMQFKVLTHQARSIDGADAPPMSLDAALDSIPYWEGWGPKSNLAAAVCRWATTAVPGNIFQVTRLAVIVAMPAPGAHPPDA